MAQFAPANVGIIGLDPTGVERFDAESYGADPSASAKLNTTAIQAALTAANTAGGGVVKITSPGVYQVNNSLTIYSNTNLILGGDVEIYSASGTNKSILINSGLNSSSSNVTLTWTSGVSLQINWTAHGLVVGDYVSIYNINPSCFNGVYRIKTVTNANVLQVDLYRDPAYIPRVSVTNGSPTVTLQQACPFSLSGYSLVTNDAVTVYTVSSHTANSATVTLSGNYSGTTSTNFTRRGSFALSPVALSGSILAKKADVNIKITGGIWNYNSSGNTAVTQSPDRHTIVFGHIANSFIGDFFGREATKYIVSIGAATNFTLNGLSVPNHDSDIVKLYGPAKNVLVNNVSGISGDDGVSFQTKEPDAFSGYRYSFGDIIDCKVNRVSVSSSGGQGTFTMYGSNEELITEIDVSNIYGEVSDNGAILVFGTGTGFVGRYGVVRVSAIRGYVQGATGSGIVINQTGSGEADFSIDDIDVTAITGIKTQNAPLLRSLEISRFIPRDFGTAGDPFNLNGITAQRITVDRCQFDFMTPSTTKYCVSVVGSSNIGYLAITRCVNRTNWFFAALDCTLRDVLVQANENFGTGDHFVRINSASGTPTVRLLDNATNTLAVVNPGVSCDLFFSGNRCSGATNGLIRTSGTPTVSVRSAGNNLVSGSWIVVPSGTPVLTVYGWDIAIDPITLTGLATTLGQFFYSTQAGAEGGPSVRSNAGWYCLAGGAAGANQNIT